MSRLANAVALIPIGFVRIGIRLANAVALIPIAFVRIGSVSGAYREDGLEFGVCEPTRECGRAHPDRLVSIGKV